MLSTPTNIKGFFFTEDLRSVSKIRQDRCIPIERYEYTLNRSRRDNGEPNPVATSGSILSITVNIGSRNSLKVFYERIKDPNPSAFSVIFDAGFDEDGYLEDYYSALILTGSIVSVDEDFQTSEAIETDVFCMTLQVLIQNLTVCGTSKNVTFPQN